MTAQGDMVGVEPGDLQSQSRSEALKRIGKSRRSAVISASCSICCQFAMGLLVNDARQ
jgi:hypothetical protein